MSSIDSLRRGRVLALKLAAALAFLAPLATRLVLGQAFFQTGSGKIENFAFVSRLEFWGGLLLVVGLATRLVALGLASTMVVALLTADRATFLDALRGAGDAGLTDVVSFVYLLFLGWLILAGPGSVSLDTLVARWLDRPSRQAEAH